MIFFPFHKWLFGAFSIILVIFKLPIHNQSSCLSREELDELTLQIEAQQKLEDDTRTSYNDVTSRMRHLEKTHKEHMVDRNQVLDQHQKDLTHNLKLNKELASRYRQLQNQFVALKNEVLDKYDDRVKLENSIKDLKQVRIWFCKLASLTLPVR